MIKQIIFALAAGTLATTAADPVVSGVLAVQRTGTNLMDVSYTLSDIDTPSVIVTMHVSTNAGSSFEVACPSVEGDVGGGIPSVASRLIVWNVGADLPGIATSQMCVRISANDTMVPIPASTFTMGDTINEGGSEELPPHTVYISAFYMDKYEVTYTQWNDVYTWALSHGYSFDNAGSGKAASHPVQTVNWYDCVKWANARSEMEGHPPCYYTSTNFIAANIYKTGNEDLANEYVNWTANGYRLPTEAEWEKAARGGLSGQRFPWSGWSIAHTRANYYSSSYYWYDTSFTSGYHPTFATGGYPYTSPVGYFAPNDYGLYDMVGNVCEVTWDWYDSAWYGKAGATQSDTRGPTSGTYRVLRGGSWDDYADGTRCAVRVYNFPDYSYVLYGFRCVRVL